MPSSRTSEVRAASDALIAALRVQRDQGPGVYPVSLQRLCDLADGLAPEQMAQAVKHKSFLDRVVLARKKDPLAPVVLKEDLEQLAASDTLLEYLLAAVVTAKQWKWPVSRLAGKLEKALRPAFQAAVDDKLRRGSLGAAVGAVTVRGQPQLFLRAQVPEAGRPLVLADRLVGKLREARDDKAAEYPVTLDRLTASLSEPPAPELVRQAVQEAPFKDSALLAVPRNLAAPVALGEDVDRLAGAPVLLEFLLNSICHQDHQAAAPAELKKKLDKKVQRAFEQSLAAQIQSGSLPPGVGWLIIKKTTYLFYLRDVRGGRSDGPSVVGASVAGGPGEGAGPDVAPEQFEQVFVDAFDRLDRQNGSHNFVSLLDLRRAIPCRREVFDAHVQRLRREGRLALSAAEGRHGLGADELAAGIPEEGSLLLYVSRLAGRHTIS